MNELAVEPTNPLSHTQRFVKPGRGDYLILIIFIFGLLGYLLAAYFYIKSQENSYIPVKDPVNQEQSIPISPASTQAQTNKSVSDPDWLKAIDLNKWSQVASSSSAITMEYPVGLINTNIINKPQMTSFAFSSKEYDDCYKSYESMEDKCQWRINQTDYSIPPSEIWINFINHKESKYLSMGPWVHDYYSEIFDALDGFQITPLKEIKLSPNIYIYKAHFEWEGLIGEDDEYWIDTGEYYINFKENKFTSPQVQQFYLEFLKRIKINGQSIIN